MNSGAVNESSVVNTIIKGLQVLVEGTMKNAGAKKNWQSSHFFTRSRRICLATRVCTHDATLGKAYNALSMV